MADSIPIPSDATEMGSGPISLTGHTSLNAFVLNLMSLIVIFQKRVQVRHLRSGWMESLIDRNVTLIKQSGDPRQDVKSI